MRPPVSAMPCFPGPSTPTVLLVFLILIDLLFCRAFRGSLAPDRILASTTDELETVAPALVLRRVHVFVAYHIVQAIIAETQLRRELGVEVVRSE